MNDPSQTVDETPAQLLETLRGATGRADLGYATPPSRLSGGFYADLVRFRLSDPPAELDRDLVARIIPNREFGIWEATIQRAVADQGFPTPRVRLTVDDAGPLGRYLIVMDAVDGKPPMAGLTIGTIASQIPALVRHLPDQLAHIAADLHALDAAPLANELDALGTSIPTSTAGFVEEQGGYAEVIQRPDLAAAAARLLASEPRTTAVAITHGDLHPFNLLVGPQGTTLVDWTVARVAHPGFTVGFTALMLANPPIPLPSVAAAMLGPVGRRIARRFLSTYRAITDGTPAAVDDAALEWNRDVHALRILVELAGWDASGTRPSSGHPWLVLEPVARAALGIGSRPGR